MTDNTAARLEPKSETDRAKSAGPATPANFSNTEKNPKYSEDFCLGIMRAKSDRLSAWLPPWTVATRKARTKKCHASVMKYPSTLMPTYTVSAMKIERLAPMRWATAPKRNENGTPAN